MLLLLTNANHFSLSREYFLIDRMSLYHEREETQWQEIRRRNCESVKMIYKKIKIKAILQPDIDRSAIPRLVYKLGDENMALIP